MTCEKTKLNRKAKVPCILLILQVFATILFYAGRESWVFVNNTVNFKYFTFSLLWVMISNALALTALSAASLYSKKIPEKKTFKAFLVIAGIICTGMFLYSLINAIIVMFDEMKHSYLLYLKDSLIPAFFLVTVPFMAIFWFKLPCKTKRVTSAIAVTVTLLIGLTYLIPLTPYKITSQPMVIDSGEGYSVVFSTNDEGTGYIEYTYEGKDYKLYDSIGGKKRTDSMIHSVSVPYEHLKNNTYKVGSVRVIESYSYGSRLGKEVLSEEYTLTVSDSENQQWLVISDWHTMLDTAYTAIDYMGDFDSVILLGDATPGVDFEQQVIRNIVQFGGEITKGAKPVLYVRGNHETRGDYASELNSALGLDEFYYTADAGPYSFIVLDSGEDKDDSHPEYGGTTDYNTYRADMIDWLSNVEPTNEKVVTLCHSWRISDVEQELSDKGWQELDRIGARLMISGHEHQCRILGDGSEREAEIFSKYPHIAGYLDGGKTGKDFIATKMTLSEEGIDLLSINNYGETVLETSYEW